jgi:hypothetical protein
MFTLTITLHFHYEAQLGRCLPSRAQPLLNLSARRHFVPDPLPDDMQSFTSMRSPGILQTLLHLSDRTLGRDTVKLYFKLSAATSKARRLVRFSHRQHVILYFKSNSSGIFGACFIVLNRILGGDRLKLYFKSAADFERTRLHLNLNFRYFSRTFTTSIKLPALL